MAKGNIPLLAFNRGLIGKTALTRVDVDRVRLGAETLENWTPRSQGNMRLRAGNEFIADVMSATPIKRIPFIARTEDTALIELRNQEMRIIVDDQYLTRPEVTTTVADPQFVAPGAWVDTSINGGTVGFSSPGLALSSFSSGAESSVRQQVNIIAGDIGKQHAIQLNVTRGPVILRVGSTTTSDNYIEETTLRTGVYNLGFVPVGTFHITILSKDRGTKIVASCEISQNLTVAVLAPWVNSDLQKIDYDQSGDVIFVACEGYRPRRIERRENNGWGVCEYSNEKGPFKNAVTQDVRLKVNTNTANGVMTAERPFFDNSHLGQVFRLYGQGFAVGEFISGDGQFSKPFKVTGVVSYEGAPPAALNTDRNWAWSAIGSWADGTARMDWMRSIDGEFGGYKPFRIVVTAPNVGFTVISAGVNGEDDDNLEAWYKVGFQPGNYTTGQATVSVNYQNDSGYGVVKVIGVTNSTQAQVEVINTVYNLDFTDTWAGEVWNDADSYPTSVALAKGRLWWGSARNVSGSVSDDYENFDPETVGDSAPIQRAIGEGPVDRITFLIPLGGVIAAGTSGSEYTIKSTSFDEAFTPTNTQIYRSTTYGSKPGVRGVRVDQTAFIVDKSGKRVLQLVPSQAAASYSAVDTMKLVPDLVPDGVQIEQLAVQRQPDTRIYGRLSDGSVIVLLYEPIEQISCWYRFSAANSGFVEQITVLPDINEDRVYFDVRRSINGVPSLYLEKSALESECNGGQINRLLDSHTYVNLAGGTTVTGAGHLEGETVRVWADGAYTGEFTVAGAQFELPAGATYNDVVYGLSYTADYQSTKLAYAAQMTALTQQKRLRNVALVLNDTHNDGIRYGSDPNKLDPLPRIVDGAAASATEIYSHYDQKSVSIPARYKEDDRLWLRAVAPLPANVSAAVITVETNER